MTFLATVLLALGLFGVFLYNLLIGRRNQVENAFGAIDALIRQRWNLVPNLVEAVQEYTDHESRVLAQLTELRTRALAGARPAEEALDLDREASLALRSLVANVEGYPELKASENFQHLQRTLAHLEEQISAARRAYNAAVTSFNDAVDMFPSNLVASWMGLQRRRVFAVDASETGAPDVGDLFDRARR